MDELHPLEWKGPCSRCGKWLAVNGLFAVQFKNGLPPVCGACQGVSKKVDEHPMVAEVRALFAAAANHHVPREGSPKVGSRMTSCATAQPNEAMAAWIAVIVKADELSACCGMDDDQWIREVKADALYGVACMQSLLGDKTAALETLDRVIRSGYAKFELMGQDADFDGLRNDSAFSTAFVAAVEEARLRVDGLTIEGVIARLGQPRKKMKTDGRKLWVYYYDAVEVYFDKDGVADWCCLEKYEDGACGE